jgi:hypothetical protein
MLILFYGTQEYGRYIAWKEMKADISPQDHVPSDVYNGGYVYLTTTREWYRCDLTPVLIADVPKILQMLVLVLNL